MSAAKHCPNTRIVTRRLGLERSASIPRGDLVKKIEKLNNGGVVYNGCQGSQHVYTQKKMVYADPSQGPRTLTRKSTSGFPNMTLAAKRNLKVRDAPVRGPCRYRAPAAHAWVTGDTEPHACIQRVPVRQSPLIRALRVHVRRPEAAPPARGAVIACMQRPAPPYLCDSARKHPLDENPGYAHESAI